MSGRIGLALAIHNHQPIGNFGWVFEDVYRQAYEPLLQALDRHPGVRIALHYTGPLIEWIRAERPQAIELLAALVSRGQVEVLGGGYYEPVLVSLPERDRHGQLVRMADEVERLFGRRPRGAWLAERVWEPQLPSVLADAGYDWTILDDNHFRSAAVAEDEMWGAYVTEDQGRLLRVFGTEQGLRYRIPFGSPEDVITYLRDRATEDGRRLGMMGDDGEKFGAWPGTYEHCWGHGRWIDRFFELLEANRGWLTTTTPSDWLDREPPAGRVYVPTASYIEMGEWALPADESTVYTGLVKRAFEQDLPEKRFLRGGFWRNFQARYREINDLHKQMLRVSEKVAAMAEGPARQAALDHLFRGQSNDCYWHGLFGGIYIVHMRLATHAHLIAAEDIADGVRADAGAAGTDEAAGHGRATADDAAGAAPRPVSLGDAPARGAALLDADLDGIPEAYLAAPGQVVVVDLAEGATIGSWDLRATRLALASVMRRRPEAYHATLRAHEAASGNGAEPAAADTHDPGDAGSETPGEMPVSGAPRTIHDLVMTKEPGLSRHLVYDRHERRSALVHLVPRDTGTASFRRQDHLELGDLVDDPYRLVSLTGDGLVAERDGTVAGQAVRARKVLRLGGGRLDPAIEVAVTVEHRGSAPLAADLVLEWNVDLAGGGGNPAAHYTVPTPEPLAPGPGAALDAAYRPQAGAGAVDPATPGSVVPAGAASVDPATPGSGAVIAAAPARYPHDSSADAGLLPWLRFGNDFEGAQVLAVPTPPASVAWYPVETVSNSEAGFERQYQGSCLLFRWPLELAPGESRTVIVRLEVASSRDHRAEELGESRPA